MLSIVFVIVVATIVTSFVILPKLDECANILRFKVLPGSIREVNVSERLGNITSSFVAEIKSSTYFL